MPMVISSMSGTFAGMDDGLTFTATRWQLFEASLVGVPADAVAGVRSIGSSNELVDIRARMLARQRMFDRMGQLDD
ncbi:hypothetical protein ABIB95_002526 [Bradyrhizobium sp. LA2.1]